MNTRLQSNSNLSVYQDFYYRGLPVQQGHGPMIEQYLEGTFQTIRKALDAHSRVFAIRVDLRVGERYEWVPDDVISRFIASFKSQIDADQARRSRQGKRVHHSAVRYVWVRERDSSLGDHYHVLLLLNLNAYAHLGDFNEMDGNLSARISMAWARAMNIGEYDGRGLVHFPQNPVYRIEREASDISDLFERVSYFAKVATKNYGDGRKSFGCSRN